MNTLDILSLEKNEASLSIIKSYLQTPLTKTDYELVFLKMLEVELFLGLSKNVITEGEDFLTNFADEDSKNYSKLLKYLFDASLIEKALEEQQKEQENAFRKKMLPRYIISLPVYFIGQIILSTIIVVLLMLIPNTMVKFLVEKGLDVNALNDQYETPIFSSVKNNNYEIVKFLVKEGAFIDIKNRRFETPHDIAIIHDRDEIRNYLEETQYQPFYQEHKKSQALTLAVLNRDYHEIRVLALAHTRLRPNKLGKTALDYAKEYRMKSAVQILNEL
jgi:ankyrin repeat protein